MTLGAENHGVNLGLEGNPGGHLTHPTALSQVIPVRLIRVLHGWVLKAFSDGNFTASMGNLFKLLATLIINFLYIQSEIPLLQLVAITFCPFALHFLRVWLSSLSSPPQSWLRQPEASCSPIWINSAPSAFCLISSALVTNCLCLFPRSSIFLLFWACSKTCLVDYSDVCGSDSPFDRT